VIGVARTDVRAAGAVRGPTKARAEVSFEGTAGGGVQDWQAAQPGQKASGTILTVSSALVSSSASTSESSESSKRSDASVEGQRAIDAQGSTRRTVTVQKDDE
jgi:hypothetical protein